ncbi:MAG: hypothetical protein RIT24_941 [Planctomycetota bacterium]
MAAKKVKRSVAAKKGAPPEAGGARVFPLAALRAALGTEVDRVRRYGGYTLILRRGRAVAAVIPYEEFERLTMQDRNRKGTKAGSAPRQMTPTELIAEVERIRAAFAKADAERLAQGLPVNTKSAAELVREGREERTQQILQAARGKHDRRSGKSKGGDRRSR